MAEWLVLLLSEDINYLKRTEVNFDFSSFFLEPYNTFFI